MVKILQTKIKYVFSAIMLVIIGFWINPAKAEAVAYSTVKWARPGTQFRVYHGSNYEMCSVGFPAVDYQGNKYFLTANHCFLNNFGKPYPDGKDTDVWDSSGKHKVGFLIAHMEILGPGSTAFDAALVRLFPEGSLEGYGWNDIPNTPHNPILGTKSCFVGYRLSKGICGAVTKLNYELRFTNWNYSYMEDAMVGCNYPGDSGGAVYDSSGAIGIVSGGFKDKKGNFICNSSTLMFFAPIMPVLNAFEAKFPGLHLV